MPELPEVQTMVNGLKRKVLKRTILEIWTDAPDIIKKPKNIEEFKKGIIAEKIDAVERKGKIILIHLSGGQTLLVHSKLTGHFLTGKWKKTGRGWKPLPKGPLSDPANKFIHLLFWLDNGLMLAFSDVRKLARIELWKTEKVSQAKIIKELGADALSPDLTLEKLGEIIKNAGKRKIKQVLMDQRLIAGIGNIYSDETLFEAGVHPFRPANTLKDEELKKILKAIKSTLAKAIELAGTSVSDFRRPDGSEGGYYDIAKVYRREKQKCFKCGAIIQRKKLGGRSVHFCPKCQRQ